MSNKQFDPSPRKLERAREKGQNAKSPIVSCLAALCGGLGGLWVGLVCWQETIVKSVRQLLTLELAGVEPLVGAALGLVGTSLIFGAAAGMWSELLQVGVQFRLGMVVPKAERLDLVKGIGRCLSGLKRVFLLYIQVVGVLGGGLYLLLSGFPSQALVSHNSVSLAPAIVQTWFRPLIYSSLLGGVICAAFSLWAARKRFLKEMKMSFQEVKDECKELEGNLEQKSARRAEHAALLRGDLVKLVRESRVIIVD